MQDVSAESNVPLRRLEVSGVDVAYRRKGSGCPLVYLHGSGLTRRWLPLYSELAERFDVIVPEHPGYGDTERPRWYRELDDIVVHYADVLSALGLDAVHLVGHSMGGRIAGSFAAVYPERVLSLTLIAPAPLPVVTPALVMDPPALGDEDDIDPQLFNDNHEAYPDFLNGDDEGDRVADDDGSDPFADPAAWDVGGAPGLYRRLARVRCPAQVVVPDEDRIVDSTCFDEWARRLGGAPVVRVSGREHPTGHLLIVQEPRRIAEIIGGLAA